MKRVRTFLDLPEFLRRTADAYGDLQKRPSFLLLLDCLDWITWFTPYLPPLSGHNKPLRIKIAKDTNGNARMWFKADSSEDSWRGDQNNNNEPIVVLSKLPSGFPKWCTAPMPVTTSLERKMKQYLLQVGDEDSKKWLLNALAGQFGINLLDTELEHGKFGLDAIASAGARKQRLHVLGSFLQLNENLFKLPPLKLFRFRLLVCRQSHPLRTKLLWCPMSLLAQSQQPTQVSESLASSGYCQ